MRRFLAVPVLLLVFALSCGIRPTGARLGGDPPLARQHVPETTVYFVRRNRLVPVPRPAMPSVPHLAIQQLFAGPSRGERAKGLTTAISARFEIVNTGDGDPRERYRDGLVYVVGPENPPVLARAQIACTVTGQPGVDQLQRFTEREIEDAEAEGSPPEGGRTDSCAKLTSRQADGSLALR